MSLIVVTHAHLSENSERPPGMPPSECEGTLRKLPVHGANPHSELFADHAQPREGRIDEMVNFSLYECQGCGHRLAVATRADKKRILRNDYRPA